MRLWTLGAGMVLGAALVAGAICSAGPAPAQSNDDLAALNQRVVALVNAAKFAEALPLAQQSIALTKARHGEDDPRYAIALNNLAELLRATNQLAEAEPLYRRALAISEKSVGPDHTGESEAILKAKAEPALILTPPKDGATPAELEVDNGLLSASEVAQLNLDADWVVLSACNTAAGEKGDAEALSGLARAFFYAKARALLVSHWYVNSEAAVQLTTGAFAELSAHPVIGRAEALRRSMARLITRGRPDQAQPEYWAPFVLVGEGAR